MSSAFVINLILCVYLLSFGEYLLCSTQNNTENELELFKAAENGKLKCIESI